MPTLPETSEVARLMARFQRAGTVAWIGLRPARQSAARVAVVDA